MNSKPPLRVLARLQDYFWPQQEQDHSFEETRAKLLCGFSGLIGTVAALHNAHILSTDTQFSPTVAAASLLCVLAYFFVPLIWHRTQSKVQATMALISLYLFHTNIQMAFDTNYQWRQEIFLIGPPVLALLLVGKRAAWVATAVISLNLIVAAIWQDHLPFGSLIVVAAVAVTLMTGLTLFHNEIERKELHLIELRDEAQRADREKSEFLAKMSHEIRTPLNGLSGILQLLDETDLTEDQKSLVATGRSSGRSLMVLINDVLDYSKIAAHGVTIESIPFSTREFLTGISAAQSGAAKAKGLTLDIEVAADVPAWIASDPTRLNQVVTNLVGNAIKFSQDGTVTVSMSVQEQMLYVAIADKGIGLTNEAQVRVFNKFEQASSATNRRYGGTGLGLSISKELVELMEGQIGVDSAPFKGSTFWFTVPLVPAEPPPKDSAPKAVVSTVQSFDGVDALVVEDNRTNQMIVRRFLESMGVNVDIVEDGRPALQHCAAKRYDLILMDIQLLDMDGVEATEILRAHPGPNQHTPIVALSANILPEQTNAYLKAGMNACLGKPFRKDELAKVMSELVKLSQADQPAA
ncbi:ATP-binding protein [uncultured Shimia sp.]|uniref:ATP-binding protein n=1 Tax=uncultured Shimia sp. TaxID=573152 RepID=UPI0026171418|nr:ATP-binding protein [uncultured Shimia sp.]